MGFLIFWIVFPFTLLLVGGLVGQYLESRHYDDIRKREAETAALVTLNYDPEDWDASASTLVRGSVVVSVDHFKKLVAGLKSLIGGRIRVYEPLMDRGRREALLRMKELAVDGGYDAVLNVRLETARIASGGADGKGTTGIEVVAYGTAIRRT
jgi:uncharacterized protein YbjQ (UPF0145 family)